MSDLLVEFRGVTKLYGEGEAAVAALAGVDLRIQAHEFVAVMGPSGSGKSTAMNILGCLDTPSSGQYYFRGVDVSSLTRDQRALLRRYYIGFVFQGFNLLKRTTALENLELPLIYRGTPRRERRKRARAALEQVGLKDRGKHTAAQLSGGQQQRVAIARALVSEPSVVFADEPTGNLDTANGEEVMQLLTELNREGTTVVIVTHSTSHAEYAHRIVNLLDGAIVTEDIKRAI